MNRPKLNGREGFTLSELLVTFAIFAVLVGVLLPAFGSAVQSYRRAGCVQNLKKIGELIHLHANDRSGEIHPGSNSRGTWSQLMAEVYFGAPMSGVPQRRWSTFYCPELLAMGHTGNSAPTTGYWNTYCINGNVMGTGVEPRPIRKVNKFESPSRVALMWDACTGVVGPPSRSLVAMAAYHVQAGNPNQAVGFVHGSSDYLKRRGGRAGTLFLDGHAELLPDPGDGKHLNIQRNDNNLW